MKEAIPDSGAPKEGRDFWGVNEISLFDTYPMPWVDELIDRLGKAGTSAPLT
jgi:hypothetical protein